MENCGLTDPILIPRPWEVLDVMNELANSGLIVVVVTHEMGFARSLGDG